VTPSPGIESFPYAERLAALREALGPAGVDALLVTSTSNLRYLVGFHGSSGALLAAAAGATLIVDGRYHTAETERIANAPGLQDVTVRLAMASLEEAVAHAVMSGPRIWNLGVEAASITLSRFDRLSEALGRLESEMPGSAAPRLRSTERVVERLRMVKDWAEISALRDAARRLSTVARHVLSGMVKAGRTERDVAADIDHALREAGFERPAFDTIVAGGPNSALPHARAGLRILKEGDGVVLDFGGVYNGYCVDLTRTVQLAPVTSEFRRLFEAVRVAQAAAVRAVAPGVQATAVDRAAREALEAAGLGDAFVHGTGHGLGLDVHEEPRISKPGGGLVDEMLQPGMVFTVEPGAYVPGLGGVRIEDDVLVVDGGCEVLTDVPIDLMCRARHE
jgi:Xaa-Pro aminopeptidase